MVKNLPANVGDARDTVYIPWRRKWQPTPVFLPENFMDIGAWWAIVHGVTRSWTQVNDHTHT